MKLVPGDYLLPSQTEAADWNFVCFCRNGTFTQNPLVFCHGGSGVSALDLKLKESYIVCAYGAVLIHSLEIFPNSLLKDAPTLK